MGSLTRRSLQLPQMENDFSFPMIPKHPLTALAEQIPSETLSLLHRQLDVSERMQERALRTKERTAFFKMSQSLSADASSEVCTWLRARPWETEFDSEISITHSRGGFFGSSETISMRKSVRTGGCNMAVLHAFTGGNF